MAGTPSAREIVQTRHVRTFIQFGAARPTNIPAYYGQDAQYLLIDNANAPEVGAVGPVYVPEPRNTSGRYRMVAKTIAPPGALPKVSVTMREKHGFVPRQFGRLGELSLYENVGECKDPSDFLNGWTDCVVIYSAGTPEMKNYGKRGNFTGDDPLEDKIAVTLESIYAIGKLTFGEKYNSAVEVKDVVYGSQVQDASCGLPDDGSQRIYALVIHGVGAALVAYSVTGGATWATAAITGIGVAADPDCIEIMGDKLVVTSSTEDAVYVATINQVTGVPGAFTKVTTGFAVGKGPTDIWVANNHEAYLCGLGGYIYKMVDPLAGVSVLDAGVATTSNLNKIHGLTDGAEIVACGATTKFLVSSNRGQTWALAASTPGASDLNSVWVVQPGLYWVVDEIGGIRYTQTGGASWAVVVPPSTFAKAKDVCFPTKEVGFIGGATSAPLGLIIATWDGGRSWAPASTPRIQQALSAQRVNRIAFPDVAALDPEVACDNVALACLGDTGVTGAVAIGATARM